MSSPSSINTHISFPKRSKEFKRVGAASLLDPVFFRSYINGILAFIFIADSIIIAVLLNVNVFFSATNLVYFAAIPVA